MLVNARADPYGASRGHACGHRISACGKGSVSYPGRSGPRCPHAPRGPPLSSAILYLAIVAIWAGVLVPRWLRPHAPRTADAESRDDPGHDEHPAAESGPGTRQAAQSNAPAHADQPHAAAPSQMHAPAHPSPAGRHASVLQARRRMLATLVLLTAGAVAIAVAHVAATWVIIPPSVMLAGFLMLLRAAARIDAKRIAPPTHPAHATAGPGAGQEPDTAWHGPHARPATSAPTRAPGASPAPGPPAQPEWEQAEPGWLTAAAPHWTPIAEIIDISGRVRDQVYDQYSDAAERAVGD
jgi:hypothetical protein